MAYNGVLVPPVKVTPQIGNAPRRKISPPLSPQTFYPHCPTGNGCFCVFTHGYFQQAHVPIFEAIITD